MVPAHAASTRTIWANPSIRFDGTQATCYVKITADRPTDKISATMELWQGDTLLNSWDGDGTWVLTLEKTETVSKGKTYDLVIKYTVNDVDKTPIRISKTNS